MQVLTSSSSKLNSFRSYSIYKIFLKFKFSASKIKRKVQNSGAHKETAAKTLETLNLKNIFPVHMYVCAFT